MTSVPHGAARRGTWWDRITRRGALEHRAQRWLADDATLLGRALRLGVLLLPAAVGFAFTIPVCPSALFARIPCPGCGLTRATVLLLSGDLAGATAINPLAIGVCPLLGGAAAYAALRYLISGRVQPARWRAAEILIGSMLALTLVWLARWAGYFGGPFEL